MGCDSLHSKNATDNVHVNVDVHEAAEAKR